MRGAGQSDLVLEPSVLAIGIRRIGGDLLRHEPEVAGDAKIGAAFEAGRKTILCLPRDRDALSREVIDMRRRMLAGHPNPTTLFDLKHDAGGMVDVEFAVQYLILAHAHDHAAQIRRARASAKN